MTDYEVLHFDVVSKLVFLLIIDIFSVGSALDDAKCIPYISEHTDCSVANACNECTRCTCGEDGKWVCRQVYECPQDDTSDLVDNEVLDNALHSLYTGVEKKKKKGPGSLVPPPPSPEEDLLLVPVVKLEDFDEELRAILSRHKRSLEDNNATVRFYETIDEINEDTLKNSNKSGTLEASKINTKDIDKSSGRGSSAEHYNESDPSSLHIKYNQPHEFEHHIAENKVDSKHPLEDTINGLTHEEIHKILGNYSQGIKNKDLSKLVVSELAHGREIIGDKSVTPLSNITFTPENDTLTAMAFIAGNLLNKLWDMEKDETDGTFETEELKHQKINDLLGLFKEPLSIRQESFLKNALEKLSHVIDKNLDLKNVSLCKKIEEAGTNKMDNSNCTGKQTNNPGVDLSKTQDKHKPDNLENQRKATTDAINKINDVLSLIKKYEQVQKSLSEIKNVQSTTNDHGMVNNAEKPNFSADENVSLNIFGDLLGKITKLLSPNKSSKKVNNKLQSFNLLRKDDIANNNIEKLFQIDFGNKTMNTKDRMIMDYLSNVERHPNCFFSHLQKPVVTPLSNVEGSILYNLSEFFKIKSFSDLLNLINDKPDIPSARNISYTTTTDNPITIRSTTIENLRTSTKSQLIKQESVKEKLKNDLKMIIQDLVELQTEHGIKPNSNINIADALPCIYNILNAESYGSRDTSNNKQINSINKIKTFIDSLKTEMQLMITTRRSNTNMSPRPKSAVVWERAIKNLDKQHKSATRRHLTRNQKSYSELKELIDDVELSSNSYKNVAIQSGVPASEKLILLKTLQADVKRYTEVLENIQSSIETITNLPVEKQNDFKEFVDNAAMNINLNKKVLEEVSTQKNSKYAIDNENAKARIINKSKKSLISKWADSSENNFKLRREQIMNQLIINRLKLYIKSKEATDSDFITDTNYNIAKRIIFYIESGNIPLAKELFKIFAATKQKDTKGENRFIEYGAPVNNRMSIAETKGLNLLAFKEPLIKVEEPKRIKILTQDYFMKQLWNRKELPE